MGKEKKKTVREKELSKMNRADLLELLIAQAKENDALKKTDELRKKENEDLASKLSQANDKLSRLEIGLKNAGSIAEACLQINDIFNTAQKAAQQYLDNIKKLNENKEADYRQIIKDAEFKSKEIIQNAKNKADLIEFEARKKSSIIISEAEKERENKKAEIDKYWNDLSTRLEAFYQSHQGLKALIQSSPK